MLKELSLNMLSNIGYLGINDSHRAVLTRVLSNKNINVHALDSSLQSPPLMCGMMSSIRTRLNRLSYQLAGNSSNWFEKRIYDFLTEHPVDVIIAYWGTNVIPDIIALKKIRPSIKIILNVLCHPMGLTKTAVTYQNTYLRFYSKYIDGFIFSNNVMREYIQNIVGISPKIPFVIIPPLHTRSEEISSLIENKLETPNIIYLGRTDWWAAQKTDNVQQYFDDIIVRGIHLHYARNQIDTTISEGFRHLFNHMQISDLNHYASQCDASLIIYNLNCCNKTDRFRTTIPDRLISSVAFGLPVAIPKQGYDGCREFLHEYGAVIEFESFDDLIWRLNDRAFIAEIRARARENSSLYCMERYVDELVNFLNIVYTSS